MTNATIRIQGPSNDPGDWLYGRWWFIVRIGDDCTSGFAYTQLSAHLKAQRKARRLAKRLAKRNPQITQEYTMNV